MVESLEFTEQKDIDILYEELDALMGQSAKEQNSFPRVTAFMKKLDEKRTK